MTYLDRIAALREALSSVAEEFSPYGHDTIAKAALSADDLAAAEPLPDLPLAEGSRWNGFDGSAHSVTDWTGDRVWLTQSRTGTMVSTSRIEEANADGPYLLDVLALARRAGVV